MALVGKVAKMRRADAPLICQIKSGQCRDGLWRTAGLESSFNSSQQAQEQTRLEQNLVSVIRNPLGFEATSQKKKQKSRRRPGS